MFQRTIVTAMAMTLCASTAIAQDLPQASSEYFTAAQANLEAAIAREPNTNQATNIILFVADGMGVGTNYGIRLFQGQQMGLLGEEHNLVYDLYPNTAIIKTYNINAQTPDSAPTAGAMNTGVKQVFNTINMADTVVHDDCSTESPLRLFSEMLSDAGKSVGVVSTARITHATGAAVYAKTANRNWEDEAPEGCTDIATQLIEQMEAGVIDIALGGGISAFAPEGTELAVGSGGRPDDANLIERAQAAGARFVYDADTLAAADAGAPILGLFSGSHMSYEYDRPETEPSLADLTAAAIEQLEGNGDGEGFYLVVEAGRVDHASHGGNAYRAFTDGVAFAEAVALADEMTDDENTLIIVTADHEHVISFNGYCGRGTPITGLCMGVASGQVEHSGEPALADDGMPYTVVSYTNGAGSVLVEQEDGTYAGSRPEVTQEAAMDPDYLQQALIPMGSETHSGVDVALWAKGPWAHLFGGTMDQEMIFHVMNHAAFGAAE
ncbi:alkaline phosphatase [Pelagibacterium xiamenense]|uniref:alkaline phosphatase n=1 Tax=Pelagibacterium xiamenense TaxID=2901140 RepID=UPI001E50DCEF|nr:alkaline phosphatase [Pelagibacterium xiamenense]MCD7059847.1 alkaline phosphatase [Pelagibacterium xiamenense]